MILNSDFRTDFKSQDVLGLLLYPKTFQTGDSSICFYQDIPALLLFNSHELPGLATMMFSFIY